MDRSSNLRRLLAGVFCAATFSIPLFAAEFVVRSEGDETEVGSFERAMKAGGKSLGINDDLFLEGKGVLDQENRRTYQCANFALRPAQKDGRDLPPALYLAKGALKVKENVTIPRGTVAVQGGTLEWGGILSLKAEPPANWAALEFIAGASEIRGRDLVLDAGSDFNLRLFAGYSNAAMTAALKKPLITLTGTLKFLPGAKFRVTYDQAAPLAPGEYRLIRARAIEGEVPPVTVLRQNQPVAGTPPSLKIDGKELLLVVP